MTARTDHLDPAEPATWQPASHEWARRNALEATAQAVNRARERRTTVNRPHDEEQM